jgi:hypothetical protein
MQLRGLIQFLGTKADLDSQYADSLTAHVFKVIGRRYGLHTRNNLHHTAIHWLILLGNSFLGLLGISLASESVQKEKEGEKEDEDDDKLWGELEGSVGGTLGKGRLRIWRFRCAVSCCTASKAVL